MATTDSPPVVSDAGPLIHLDELQCLDLLRDFGPILVPPEVWAEVSRHRPQLTAGDVAGARIVGVASEPSPRLVALCRSLGLDVGETAALTLMEGVSGKLLLCDDAAARLAAESLGFVSRGTIGILVRSIRTRARSREQVLAILRAIPVRSTLHVSHQLLADVIGQVERSSGTS